MADPVPPAVHAPRTAPAPRRPGPPPPPGARPADEGVEGQLQVLRTQLDRAFDDVERRLEDAATRAGVAEARASVAEARASVAETRAVEAERRADTAHRRVDELVAALTGRPLPPIEVIDAPAAGDDAEAQGAEREPIADDALADVTPPEAADLRSALERLRTRLDG
jgi:hypothetical protein